MRRTQSESRPFKPLYIPQTSAEMTIPLELLEHDTPPPTKPKIAQSTTLNYSEQPSYGPPSLHQQMSDLSPFAYYAQQGHSGEGSSSSSYSYPQHAGDGERLPPSDPYYFSHQNTVARPTMVPGTFDLSLYAASPEVARQDAESGNHYNL